MSIPHLEHRGDKTVLMVHDEALILLAGEVHNSNSSSLSYMEGVWDKAEYPLPMAVNCWLDKGGAPGTYPSGGPVSRTREV